MVHAGIAGEFAVLLMYLNLYVLENMRIIYHINYNSLCLYLYLYYY